MIEFGEIQPQPVLGLSISLIPETLPDGSRGLEVMSVTEDLSGDNVVESNTDEEQKAIAELKSLGIDTTLLENRFRM